MKESKKKEHQMNNITDLEKLAELKEKGIISQEEFNQQKERILNSTFNSKTSDRKSRLIYILLALFLGSLGTHNFYAGYSGKGTIQLLLSLFLFWLIIPIIIVFIWVIVDIITVTKDANGTPFE